MKIKKIMNDGDPNPWNPSLKQTKKVVDFLESSEIFDKEVIRLREKYNVPKSWIINGLSSIPEMDYKWGWEVMDSFFNECQSLNNQLNLPQDWWGSLAYFIAFDIFFIPELDFLSIYPSDYHGTVLTGHGTFSEGITKDASRNYCFIILKNNLTKKELKQQIDINWNTIKKATKNLPAMPAHRMQQVEIAKKVVDLKDNSNPPKTFSQIADELGKNYQADMGLYDKLNENYVKQLYHRWKKKVTHKDEFPHF